MKRIINSFLLAFLLLLSTSVSARVLVGAEQTDIYLPILAEKRVGLFSNHTGMVGKKHTLDILVENGVDVTAIFSPEHGFRGTAGAGDHVANDVDAKTGIPILSLYTGKTPRPSDEAMAMFDILIVDIQDVGLRYYTYYISMVRLMDACADFGKTMLILDRPNPNGYYVDGPILDMKHKSGVGWLPIPIVHGMTLAELALMVNGEKWLPDGKQCTLEIVPCKNYTHQTLYELPIPPSPNLQNMLSIYLYPATCYFEATPVSLGRGTDKPFLCYGHPDFNPLQLPPQGESQSEGSKVRKLEGVHATVVAMRGVKDNYSFTPRSMTSAPKPPQQDKLCYGVDLSGMKVKDARKLGVDFSFLIDAYNACGRPENFFRGFMEKLAGVDYVREMIIAGKSNEEIKAMWQDDVIKFKQQRKPYLIYKE